MLACYRDEGNERRTSVELGESKTDKAISVGILNERLRDSVGELDSLILDCDAANCNGVSTNSASSTRRGAVEWWKKEQK